MKQKGGAGPSSSSSGMDVAAIEKSLEGLSTDDKISKLVKKLAESEELNGKLKEKASQVDVLTKANVMLVKKAEKSNSILLRTEESKSKLEELCRELQKYNKQIREESIAKVRALEAQRTQSVESMKNTLKDIETSMNEGKGKSDLLAEDNKRLAGKLSELGTHYEERVGAIEHTYQQKEKYWEELLKTRDLEVKLLKAKLDANNINLQKIGLEKDELTRSLIEGSARVGGAIENEKALREQVQQYSARYEQLTASLSSSNQAFDKFKKEIDRVNSNLKKVENDSMKWKLKYDEASKNVLVLTMSKKELEEKIALQAKQIAKLEGLCRALTTRKAEESTVDPAKATESASAEPSNEAPAEEAVVSSEVKAE